MLDTNIIDRLASDPEAVSEAGNRHDLLFFVTDVQLAQLAAIPDAVRCEAMLALARRLCRTLAAPAGGAGSRSMTGQPPPMRHEADARIAAASLGRCDLLVTDDTGLLEHARRNGLPATDWHDFATTVLFAPKQASRRHRKHPTHGPGGDRLPGVTVDHPHADRKKT